jgi:hypothetical protein
MSDSHRQTDTESAGGAGWAAPPTAKDRAAVQRAVDRLLDDLAPERAATHVERPPAAIERHRTPRGCILQAATGAVSVSWFPDSANEAALGELQVVAWQGHVSRPGSAHRTGGATVARELVLRPIEKGAAGLEWEAADGTRYDTDALAAYCRALLEDRMRETGAAPTA